MTREPVGGDVADRNAELLERAERSGTSQLRVVLGAETLAASGDARPLHTASVTKLLMGVAVARSVSLGRLRLDDPVARWVPSWSADDRALITVRHVLGHASGLDASTWGAAANGSVEDLLGLVVDRLPVAHEPGRYVEYNNLATMLLPAVLARASGRPFREVVRLDVTDPLGFGEWDWLHDAAGNALGMSGAMVSAEDLARVGTLLAQDGRWETEQLLPRRWVTAARPPVSGSSRLGLGLMTHTAAAGTVYGHDGSGGQHLWVGPRSGVVVARLHDLPWEQGDAGVAAGFRDLPDLTAALDAAISDDL